MQRDQGASASAVLSGNSHLLCIAAPLRHRYLLLLLLHSSASVACCCASQPPAPSCHHTAHC